MDERSYYSESQATKPAQLNCPYCRTQDTYELRWAVRKKKERLPPGGDEREPAAGVGQRQKPVQPVW